MQEPLAPEQSEVLSPNIPTPSTEAVGDETVQTAREKTAAVVLASLTGEERINVLTREPIREEHLRNLLEKLLDRPEVLDLKKTDLEITRARGMDIDGTPLDALVQKNVEQLQLVSQVFLADAEAACAEPEMDVTKTRVQIHFAYSHAKALSGGRHKIPDALNALKAWQATLTTTHPEAVAQLVESYKQAIAAEITGKKPDMIWIAQWVDLCAGFAPELAADLAEMSHKAVVTRCEFFIAKVEEELAKPRPDMRVIGMNICVPANYYAQLRPGSTIPDKMKELQDRVVALGTK